MTTITDSPPGTEIVGRTAIMDALDRHHVQYRNWGKELPFTLEHLIEGLDTEEMKLLEIKPAGRLLLKTKSVRVVPEYIHNGTLIELHESHWIWPRETGIKIPRNFRGISKTRRRGESALDTARLALATEPGFSEPGFRDPANYELEHISVLAQDSVLQKSDKWSGLDVNYDFEVYHCKILGKIFWENGYFMVKWNMSTRYLWKTI